MRKLILALLIFSGSVNAVLAQRIMEKLDRGLVVIDKGSTVFAAWRMLGTDPDNVEFDLFRNNTKVNTSRISSSTNFEYTYGGSSNDEYKVIAYLNGEVLDESSAVKVWTESGKDHVGVTAFYKSIPITPPTGGTTPDGVQYTYSANDISVGDLDNDGEYEIILKWYPSNSKDNSQSGYTGNTILEALEYDGTSLWKIDLGINIRSGAHYTQFMVYDLDSDGYAEVACKTADGTKDAAGNIIGSNSADYRNSAGYVLDGPEFLTVFSGQTGEELVTTDYYPARGSVAAWGDSYGNRVDRFLATIAYLDGQRPSLVMCRGYYTRTVLAAYDYRGGELSTRWIFDTNNAYSDYTGQGAHSISVGDVDEDGKDEILYGAAAIDDDGTGLYNTKMGHGDATHLADIDPDEPGLEFFMPHEASKGTAEMPNMSIRNAGNGEMQWVIEGNAGDIGRGLTMDLDPNHYGYEVWASDGSGVYDKDGKLITTTYPQNTSGGNSPSYNFGVWWDGDLTREILDRGVINKWNPESFGSERMNSLYSISGAEGSMNNGTKNNPCLSGDILGDWREEIILRNSESTKLFVYVNTDNSPYKLRTLMHDPEYRLAIAWQNVGYNQPPHPGFYLGEGMETPAKPDIKLADACLANLQTVPFGDYTQSELSGLGLDLSDITNWDLPNGSTLLLFDQDDYQGNSTSVRGKGSCDVNQPEGSFTSAMLLSQTFAPDITYQIKSMADGSLITVEGAEKDEGTPIILSQDDSGNDVSGNNQVWSFEKYLGSYVIKGFHSRGYISVNSNSDVVLTRSMDISDSETFDVEFYSNNNTYFQLVNKSNNKCLTMASDGSITCETCDQSNTNQLFSEQVKWSERVCQTLPFGTYTQAEISENEVDLSDIIDLDIPEGSSLILFENDDFEGNSSIIRGSGCGNTQQPSGTYQSAILTEGLLGEDIHYIIKSRYNNKRLTLKNSSTLPGTLVILESESKGDETIDKINQVWTVEDNGDNYYVRSFYTKAAITVDSALYLVQGEKSADSSNEFDLVMKETDNKYFQLKSLSNDQCMALVGGDGELGCKECNINDLKQLFYEEVSWSVAHVLGVEESKELGILFYPNPTQSYLFFQLDDVDQVEILSMSGKQVMQKTIKDEYRIDLSGLEKGTYILRISASGKVHTSKIVKE